MDTVLSPMVKAIIDMALSYLISKGILDVHYKDTVLSLINSLVAGMVVVIPSVYGMYKVVEASKHNVSMKATQSTLTVSKPGSTTQLTQETVQPALQPDAGTQQTGLPLGK